MSRLPIAEHVAAGMKSASFIREMFEKGRALKALHGEANVFDFSLGNPNASPPHEFFESLQAVAAELQPARHRYMPNAGFEDARAAVAAFVAAEYRIELDGGGVILTSGAAGGLNIVLRAICNPGDEIIVLAPCFPEYRFYIQQAGGVMRLVGTDENFQPNADEIARAVGPRTRGLILNSPNNPTGAVYSAEALQRLAEVLRRRDSDDQPIYLITDDPYRRILYESDWCPTPVAFYPRTVLVSSYSKDLSIPGERLGYVAVPPRLPQRQLVVNALGVLNRTLGFVNAPAFMQRVIARCATAACDTGNYRANRQMLCNGLQAIGYDFLWPAGALYVFPRTPLADDIRFTEMLLQERILAVPGSGFGCPGRMRLCFSVERATIEGALPGFRRVFAACESAAV